MSQAPNADTLNQGNPTKELEPLKPEAQPGRDAEAPMLDPGPAEPRPDVPPDKEFDTMDSPHFL